MILEQDKVARSGIMLHGMAGGDGAEREIDARQPGAAASNNSSRVQPAAAVASAAAIGRVNENVAPTPFSLFLAHILPPCASTSFLHR